MDYIIKQDRGAWVAELCEGRFAGTRYRWSTKRALVAGMPGIFAHLATLKAEVAS